jgi:hypothetical protein
MSVPKKSLIVIKADQVISMERVNLLQQMIRQSGVGESFDVIVLDDGVDASVYRDLDPLVKAIQGQCKAIADLTEATAQSVALTAELLEIITQDDDDEVPSSYLSGAPINAN